jgi:PAT family beta-lactamase induction signal transducer AmpG
MTMGVAANTFYLDTGYTLDQIAVVSKVYGVIMTLTGGLIGGVLVARIGVYRTLIVGWALLTIANLVYSWLATQPADVWKLAGAISIDNFGDGIAGGSFIAYMSSLTNRAYTATQYALFGTLWSLPAKSLASAWGAIVDAIGYPLFFCYTAAIGLPSLLLILYLRRLPPPPSAAS